MVSKQFLLPTQFCFYFVNVRNFGCIEIHALLFNLALEGKVRLSFKMRIYQHIIPAARVAQSVER